MANIEVKLRRGTDTEHSSFTGAEGEVTVDTTNDTLRVHDGTTAGGVRLAKLSEAGLSAIANLSALGNVSGASAVPVAIDIKDEDAMTSNSATALATQQSIKAYVDSNAGIPTGTVSAFAGSAAPTGYALCDGSAVNRTVQAALCSVIGTTYGTGDGSTTFNLPDLRGRVVAGLGESLLGATADELGDDNGLIANTKEHTLLETELPAHDHFTLNNNAGNSGNSVDTTNSASFSTSFGGDSSYQMAAPTADPVANIGLSSETGGGLAHPNVQPTIILNYIIKT
mgnify:CR=1 FL=1